MQVSKENFMLTSQDVGRYIWHKPPPIYFYMRFVYKLQDGKLTADYTYLQQKLSVMWNIYDNWFINIYIDVSIFWILQ